MLDEGGEAIAGIDVMRHQGPLLGPVATATGLRSKGLVSFRSLRGRKGAIADR